MIAIAAPEIVAIAPPLGIVAVAHARTGRASAASKVVGIFVVAWGVTGRAR
jgi:hypothetical protein